MSWKISIPYRNRCWNFHFFFSKQDFVDWEERRENGRKYSLIKFFNHEKSGENITCLLLTSLWYLFPYGLKFYILEGLGRYSECVATTHNLKEIRFKSNLVNKKVAKLVIFKNLFYSSIVDLPCCVNFCCTKLVIFNHWLKQFCDIKLKFKCDSYSISIKKKRITDLPTIRFISLWEKTHTHKTLWDGNNWINQIYNMTKNLSPSEFWVPYVWTFYM